MPGAVRIVPLGGLGEIGLNMLVVEAEGAAIAIDCGVLFPERPGLGVDLLLPDVTYLRERPGLLRAVVLTHGHEDHIGALPRLLAEFPVPVFAPRFAAALASEKLRRNRIAVPVETFEPGASFSIGPFSIEPIHVTHSIVDAVALAIETPQGTIFHTGDFKIDPHPVDGRAADLARIAEWGRRGILLLLSDSTNVEHDGACGSESEVGPRMAELVAQTRGRVLVTTFSSHLHRVQQAIDASLAAGRRVAVAGRGFEDSTRLASELGYLRVPTGGLVSLDDACRLDPATVTIVISGSQGEPTSALARLSDGQYKQLTVGEGDAVILSARVIPGNERSVHALLNRLAKRGAEIHHGSRAGVHVSGHAYRDELCTMLELTRPRYFVPVHGEYRQLDEHRRLAAGTGLVPLDRCILLEDGDVLEIERDAARTGERVVAGRVLVDGTGEGDVDVEVLRDRRHLSEDGFVVAVLAIHQQTGEVTSGPELITRGVLREEEGPEYLDDAKAAVLEKLREITPESRADLLEVEDEVRRVLKRYFSRTRGRRPLIVPHIFEL
jgi:ribonuclease J